MSNTTIEFNEVQRFKTWWAWAGVLVLNILFIYAIVQQVILDKPIGNKPAPDIVLILVALVPLLLLIFLLTIKLKTRVNDTGIHYRFYPFHFTERKIEWHELRDAYMRQYNSFYEFGGWGIRYGTAKAGRAVNTSASSDIGLQLQFNNGTLLLIGTARPEELRQVIDRVMKAGKINRGI